MAKDCYIYGFASRGEVCVPTKVESLCDFMDKFGEPENPIQEHLFRTVKEQLEKNNNVTVIRIEQIFDIYKKVADDFKYNEGTICIEPVNLEPIFWKDLTPNEQIAYRGMEQETFGPRFDDILLFYLNEKFPEGAKKNITYFTAGAWVPSSMYGEEITRDLH